MLIYYTGDPLDVILNCVAMDFVHKLDEEFVSSGWFDPDFRYLKAATVELIIRKFLDVEKLEDALDRYTDELEGEKGAEGINRKESIRRELSIGNQREQSELGRDVMVASRLKGSAKKFKTSRSASLDFETHEEEEKEDHMVENYIKDIKEFARILNDRPRVYFFNYNAFFLKGVYAPPFACMRRFCKQWQERCGKPIFDRWSKYRVWKMFEREGNHPQGIFPRIDTSGTESRQSVKKWEDGWDGHLYNTKDAMEKIRRRFEYMMSMEDPQDPGGEEKEDKTGVPCDTLEEKKLVDKFYNEVKLKYEESATQDYYKRMTMGLYFNETIENLKSKKHKLDKKLKRIARGKREDDEVGEWPTRIYDYLSMLFLIFDGLMSWITTVVQFIFPYVVLCALVYMPFCFSDPESDDGL